MAKRTNRTNRTNRTISRSSPQRQPRKQQPQGQPHWQPIERLALIAPHIDGMLADAIEHYETLQEAQPKPYVLDDYTIGRVIEVFTAQQNDLWLFDEQLRRWAAGKLTSAQHTEVQRLGGQMLRLHEVITSILRLADELKEGTIEKQLAKSDIELGIEELLKRGSFGV